MTAAMRSFFMPGKIKVYVLKIPLPTKKEYRLVPILHIIIQLVVPNGTYHVVPDSLCQDSSALWNYKAKSTYKRLDS